MSSCTRPADSGASWTAKIFLSGVDAALDRYPEADTTRLGVSGGSYGGFMSNWLTATTDRFRAAVTSRLYRQLGELVGILGRPTAD